MYSVKRVGRRAWKITCWILVLMGPMMGQAQRYYKLQEIRMTYMLPTGRDGLSETYFVIRPQLKVVDWDKKAEIMLRIDFDASMPSNLVDRFKYEYIYKGQLYPMDKSFFEDIRINRSLVRFKVYLFGAGCGGINVTKIVYGDDNSLAYTLDKNCDPSKLLFVVQEISGVQFENVGKIERAILDIRKQDQERNKDKAVSNQNTSVKSADPTTNKNNVNTTKSPDPKSSERAPIKQSTNASPTEVVRDNAGNYYQKYSDGTYRQITKEVYEQTRQAKAEERAAAQAAEKKRADQRYADSTITALNGSSNKMLEYNRKSQEESDRMRSLIGQNFYAAQQLSDARSNFQQQSKLEERYNSVEELERDYRQKLSNLSGSANQLAEAKNQSLQSNYEYQFRDADESGKALGQAVVGIGSMINNISAEKQAEKARRELAEARAAAIKKMEKEKKDAQVAARKKLLLDFPDGGTPLSSHRVSTNEVYLFAYSIPPSKLEEDTPPLLITNVFPVGKRSDDTWPFKSSILGDLSRLSMNQPITVFGYFASKEKAEEWNASFKRIAAQSGMRIQAINYAGKPGTDRNRSNSSEKESNSDFFGNPTKGTKTETKKSKVDFFGNPIKD